MPCERSSLFTKDVQILVTETLIGFKVISLGPFIPRFDEYDPIVGVAILDES